MKTLKALLVLMIGSIGFCYGQNPINSRLTWSASEVTNVQTSATKGTKSQFVTIDDESVELIQKGGQRRTVFTVTHVEGSWRSVSRTGQIVYTLQLNDKTGTLTLERNQNGLFATMDFSRQGEYTSILRFRIASVAEE